MATIPTADEQSVSSTPTPGVSLPQVSPNALGANLALTGSKLALREQAREDLSVQNSALTDIRDFADTGLYGNQGITHMSGAALQREIGPRIEAFQSYVAERTKDLSDDQRQGLANRLQLTSDAYRNTIERHAASDMQRVEVESFTANQVSLRQQAVRAAGRGDVGFVTIPQIQRDGSVEETPALDTREIDRIIKAQIEDANDWATLNEELLHLPLAKWNAQAEQQIRSETHVAVLKQLNARGDDLAVAAYLELNKDELDGDARAHWTARSADSTRLGRADRVLQSVLEEHEFVEGSPEFMQAAAEAAGLDRPYTFDTWVSKVLAEGRERFQGDPQMQREFKAHALDRIAEIRAARDADQRQVTEELRAMLDANGGDVSRLRTLQPDLWALAGEDGQTSLEKHGAILTSGLDQAQEQRRFLDFMDEALADPQAARTKYSDRALFPQLTEPHFNTLKEVLDGSQEGARSKWQMVKDRAASAGWTGTGSGRAQLAEALYDFVDENVAAAGGLKNVSVSDMQDILDRGTATFSRMGWFREDKKVSQLELADIQLSDIPRLERGAITERLAARGIEATDDLIRVTYLAGLRTGEFSYR